MISLSVFGGKKMMEKQCSFEAARLFPDSSLVCDCVIAPQLFQMCPAR